MSRWNNVTVQDHNIYSTNIFKSTIHVCKDRKYVNKGNMQRTTISILLY